MDIQNSLSYLSFVVKQQKRAGETHSFAANYQQIVTLTIAYV